MSFVQTPINKDIILKNHSEIPEPDEFPDEPDEYPFNPEPYEPSYPGSPEPEPSQPSEPEDGAEHLD